MRKGTLAQSRMKMGHGGPTSTLGADSLTASAALFNFEQAELERLEKLRERRKKTLAYLKTLPPII